MTSKIGNQCLNAAALLWKQSSKLDPSDPETTAAFVKYHLAEHLIFRGGPKSTKFHGLLTQAGASHDVSGVTADHANAAILCRFGP